MKTDKNILIWRIFYLKNNIIHLEGKDNFILPHEKYFYFCKLGKKIIYPEYFYYSGYDLITMYGKINKGRIVVFDIKLENINSQTLEFFISFNDYNVEIFPSLGWFIPISNTLNGYYSSEEYIVSLNDRRFKIYKYNESLRISLEKNNIAELKKLKKFNIIQLRNNYFKYGHNKRDNKTEVWIINDKKNIAGDNGEFFFRYLKTISPKNIKYYFTINKNSSDYKRLEPLGNILE